ncbi:MAG: MFS transporter, partial [Anaerolineae bacterium]|nr:MFS transporter [Anaerolineae bacterium]MDW8171719.1 MFS transporter [Anaerolineae bacterium]
MSAATSERLPVKTKLAYGAGDLGAAITAAITGFFLNAFLLDVAQLRPALVGIIFLVSTIWDAITDPIVGSLSDRTRTRWGRRRPWLLFGALPFGLTFIMQWLVPDLDENGLFLYYLTAALLLKTAFTVVNIPYTSMTPELTPNYDERTRLTAYRFSFSILGGVAAVGLHPVIVGLLPDIKGGYALSAIVWAIFIIGSAWVTFAFTREAAPRQDEPLGFVAGLRVTLSNRPFLLVTGIYLLSWLTLQFVQTNLLLYVRYWVEAEDSFTLLVLILQVTAFIALSLWSWVSARLGKKRTYMIGATLWALTMGLVFLIPPQSLTPLYFVAFFAGLGVSVAYLLPWSMLPDVVEVDELQTGQRREGAYYGIFVFLQKIGLSLGLALSNFVLDAAGYVNPEVAGGAVTQPDSVLLVLRLFVSLVPLAILLISLPIAAAYPITPQSFAELRARL